MQSTDSAAFRALIADVFAFYRASISEFALRVWWEAMHPFDLAAVKDALNRHCVNPDNGQFLPKPADVVRLLGGSNLDRATAAWTKVQKAVQHVGTYESVCFDDPIINCVISEMGGWIGFGVIEDRELPFKQREFEQRYRAYRTRGEADSYPRFLEGRFALQNGAMGYKSAPPVLIGDSHKAQLVYRDGDKKGGPSFTRLDPAVLKAIESKETQSA